MKIDRLYMDIQLLTTIGIGKRVIDIGDSVLKIASEAQEIYAYQSTVGIERALENVIQLLDLDAQDTMPVVVVVYGFGGIGKTTLADAVYSQLNLRSYTHCRIHMEQDCTSNDVKSFQEQILNGLFRENITLKNCDEGRARLRLLLQESHNHPLFLYIDNGLKSRDLEQLLPQRLGTYLPPKSRILVTTRNLQETDIFAGRNIERLQYNVNPLPETEAIKLLLEKVTDYNDKDNIDNLLQMCGGVPLLLELAGSQLAINRGNPKNIVLQMLKGGEKVKERDISERMVDFVYDRLLPPVQEAFLDIAFYFYSWRSSKVASIVGEEEFRTLKAASFVKTDEDGFVIVHDIVRARGKKLSEQEGNRIRDPESLVECLKDEEKLSKLKGIYFDEKYEQPPVEINCHHLNYMSNSLKVLRYRGSQITFTQKCLKPFKQLVFLRIDSEVPDLPMEFDKLEHIVYYDGPLMQGMNLYEFPPSLRYMYIEDYSENRVAYSKIPANVTPASSLEKNAKVARWSGEADKVRELQELPSQLRDISILKHLTLVRCDELKELPSNIGQFSNLTALQIRNFCALRALPSNFGQLLKLKKLDLSYCSGLAELPSDFGQLHNLKKLSLRRCLLLEEWPLSLSNLTELKEIDLTECCSKLKDLLPENIKENNCIILD